MEFLAAVGMMAILGVVVILIISHLNSQARETVNPRRNQYPSDKKNQLEYERIIISQVNREIESIKSSLTNKLGYLPKSLPWRVLAHHSTKCTKLALEKHRTGSDELPGSKLPSDQELKRILKDPLEFWRATENYYQDLDNKKALKERLEETNQLIVKYQDLIYSIFDNKIYLSKAEILLSIQNLLKIQNSTAEDIFNQWEKHTLIWPDSYQIDDEESPKHNTWVITDVYYITELLAATSENTFGPKFTSSREDWLMKNKKELIDNLFDDYIGY